MSWNVFEELVNPASRHTHDERNRLELTRDEEGNADPGRGPVDLESGCVVIRVPGRESQREGQASD